MFVLTYVKFVFSQTPVFIEQDSTRRTKMLKVLSLRDFDPPSFNDQATASFLNNGPVYCTKEEIQHQETQPYFTLLRDFPAINITLEMLATRETACRVGARDLFLPVQDSAYKKVANIWREKGILEAIRTAAAEDPREITYPIHWLTTRYLETIRFLV